MNMKLLAKISLDYITYNSRDYVGDDNITKFPKEFLNKLEFPNIPPH